MHNLERMEAVLNGQIEKILLKAESGETLEFAEMQILKQAIIDEQTRLEREKYIAEQEASKEQREESRVALTQALTAVMSSI